jgi:protein-S-isoprenylcysteine O-methyltransferase Ste14
MTRFQALFVWTGGAVFVTALAVCGYAYGVTWGRPAPFSPVPAALDVLLFSAFALHHSLFARERVKAWLARAVPERLLRSVYVWLASALLIGVCLLWQPVGGELYRHTGPAAAVHATVQVLGVLVVALATRSIDPLELAGIRPPRAAEALQAGGPYRWVRHPLYSGWLLATFGTAHMTGDRLLFAGIAACYLIVAMPLEERSLRRTFGPAYDRYARTVRYRVVPYVY